MATTDFTNGVTLSDAGWADDVDATTYASLTGVGGTGNAITATGPATYSYSATRTPIYLLPTNNNSGATTINVTQSGGSALGAKNIFSGGAACVGGELVVGTSVALQYDGTQFHIIGGIKPATQAQQETGTALTAVVTPGRQQFHPSAAKAWVQYDSAGGLTSSYNLSSVTDNGAGNLSPVWNVDFSSANYCVVANHEVTHSGTAASTYTTQVLSRSVGGCNVATIRMSDFTQIDVTYVSVVAFGDQ